MPGRFGCDFEIINFETQIKDGYCEHFLLNCLQGKATRPHWWWVGIGSGNGLVPLGNKPLPEPISTHIYDAYCAIRPRWVNIHPSESIKHNGLRHCNTQMYIILMHDLTQWGQHKISPILTLGSATKFQEILPIIFNAINDIQSIKVLQNYRYPYKLWRKPVQLFSHQCACWWPSTIRC